jgi:mannose-6-phosphate isomerase-like protein (cupin superfamily)
MADQLPCRIEKPWGYELLFARTPKYAGKVIFIKKGHRLSLQYHRNKDESMFLYEGQARIEIEGNDGNLVQTMAQPGYCLRIQPLTKHRLQAIEDTVLFEVSTPELDDIERLEDDYGRAT